MFSGKVFPVLWAVAGVRGKKRYSVTPDLASRRSLSILLGVLVLVLLYGCQAGEQRESRSSEGAAQNSGPEEAGQTRGVDPDGA